MAGTLLNNKKEPTFGSFLCCFLDGLFKFFQNDRVSQALSTLSIIRLRGPDTRGHKQIRLGKTIPNAALLKLVVSPRPSPHLIYPVAAPRD
jgi:hypothetical protein